MSGYVVDHPTQGYYNIYVEHIC
ncbi:hypothetical protein LCGC14_2207230, partial [marine sediment metagenome]